MPKSRSNIFFVKKQTKLTFLLTALLGANSFTIKKPCKYIFYFLALNNNKKKQVMAIFEVDFIFCCPCFIDDIFETRYFSYIKKYEFEHFVRRRHPKELFDVDDFQDEKTILISYFIHFGDSMYLDLLECLQYNKKVYYRINLGNISPHHKKYCLCYRRSVRKLLKFFPRFIA